MESDLQEYFSRQGVDVSRITKTDIVLALLRMGRVGEAEELAGIRIKVCPPYIPQWPPKPVLREKRGPVLSFVAPNPCMPAGDMHRRFAMVRTGMSRQQLRDKGISPRDIAEWEKRGMIGWE